LRPSFKAELLTVSYGSLVVLDGVDFAVEGPGVLQVLGPNGAGKTTLLKAALGLVKPAGGRVELCGVDVTGSAKKARKLAGYLPQWSGAQDLALPATPWELVEAELLIREPRLRRSEAEERVARALASVGLGEELWHRPLSKLSGGERQRAMIAKALAHDPPVLLLDEPLGPVDVVGRAEVAEVLAKLAEKALVVVTTHDPTPLLRSTKWILLLRRRVVFFGDARSALTPENVEKAFGVPRDLFAMAAAEGECACAVPGLAR